ncbi:peptidoglycan D,D-transpeptidase FtsI family protein [Candidatus Protochlamydia phocaeensis]|uniref:peptidoglycan D,D-transpeptidase FtsI family protein n=1 Tax=Candidatus Protochlamydia phocaeensis TaxID=1414722 RepID=UPI0008380B5A|nr:penicillin-binding protein 2 [Candidatus Protochlamydia phocaeensis]
MSNVPIHSSERSRLVWIALFLFVLFSLLIAQFYNIQILEGKKWAQQAQKQHFFIVKEPFIRGTFYSNPFIKKGHLANPQPFVMDVPKFHLYIDPESIPSLLKEDISDYLSASLDVPLAERPVFRQQFDKQTRSRKLAMWLDKETYQAIYKWWQGYAKQHKIARNALFFIKDYQRSYPFGKLLGQVLHTIQKHKDEATHQALPTGGLELYFNSYLQGKQGKRRLMRSPRNSLETGEVIDYPDHGADIYLTINPCLQAIAEEEIERGVKRCKAKGGWAAMMDPRTGEILALAQYPFFYPPDYQNYFNDLQSVEHTKVKAITDANEPGSVFKPFTVAVALKANKYLRQKGEKELFSPEEKMATSNGRFPGRSKPITDTSLHYYLNMDMGMQKSSNIYMGRLAEKIVARLGNEWYRRQLQLFGFGQKTHIELPAESPGVLPTPGKYHPNGALEWSIPTPFSLAMGHNIQVTSLQLLRAYSVLANGGFLVSPTLVRRIVKRDRNGEEYVLVDNTTEERLKQFPRVLDEDIVQRVVQSMRYVTKPGGTAIRADVPGYTEVGKTSTPKKIVNGVYSETLYCPTFAGFTPVKNPAFVLAVTMDEPEYGYTPGIGKNHNGGNCTATVFREIAKRSLEYLGIPTDDPYGYPYGDPRSNLEKTEWMPETRKLQEIYNKWNKVHRVGK